MSHLTENQVRLLLGGALPPEEHVALLEHTLSCDDCAALLWAGNAALPAVTPPPGMEARVLERARQKPRQESLRSYALRVAAAMAAALILLFSGAFQKLAQLPENLPKISQSIRTQITEFIDLTKEGLRFASEPK